MFLENKYTKWYNNIIAKAKERHNYQGYTEKHHIIPKSLGGSDEPSNIVRLTPKEHYVCHRLLTGMFTGNARSKMIRAFWMIATMGNKNQKRIKVGSKKYCILKEQWLQHGNLNKPKSEEHKAKMRKPKSEEHKRKLSQSRKGKSYGYKQTEKQKTAASKIWKGKTRSTECCCIYCKKETSFLNFSKWHGDRCKLSPEYQVPLIKKKKCIHCKKEVDIANYAQWHGDRCKLSIIQT